MNADRLMRYCLDGFHHRKDVRLNVKKKQGANTLALAIMVAGRTVNGKKHQIRLALRVGRKAHTIFMN